MSFAAMVEKLRHKYPSAESDGFRFADIDCVLSIRLKGTDVHRSLRGPGGNSGKDQIDLTYGPSLPEGKSPVDDFFPTVNLPTHFRQNNHILLDCRVWGECLEDDKPRWVPDRLDVVRTVDRNGRNPGLQLRGVGQLRKRLPENSWLAIVHRRAQSSFEAFSLEDGDWDGKKKEVLIGSQELGRVDFDFSRIAPAADSEEPELDELAKELVPDFVAYLEGKLLFKPLDVARFVVSLATKPFVILTGNSGTGKTKLAQTFAGWATGWDEARYAVVPVGADWTDGRHVLGYLNPLRSDGEGKGVVYQSTVILDLIIEANLNPYQPYFLILDEMNLSHVERYLSDFLSLLESGEKLALHSEPKPVATSSGRELHSSIGFPRNLFLVGTVNVDETTYMFSPKVLDRANVIELGADDLEKYLETEVWGDPRSGLAPDGFDRGFMKLAFRARSLPYLEEATTPLAEIEGIADVRQHLISLFNLLREKGLEFAYRSAMEILRYLRVEKAVDLPSDVQHRGLDLQILQKILPKLHGSRRKLEPTLVALATYCEAGSLDQALPFLKTSATPASYLTSRDRFEGHTLLFPLSHGKLLNMIDTVRRDQFVSFIQ